MKNWKFWGIIAATVVTAVVLRLFLGRYLHPLDKDPLKIIATVAVVDEDGKPIKDANVCLWTYQVKTPTTLIQTYNCAKPSQTNNSGKASVAARGDLSKYISVGADKEGYYTSSERILPIDGMTANWRPKARLILRKKQNPVPMHVNEVCLYIHKKDPIPQNGAGFDLVIGDWVKPRGKGEVADFIFHFQRQESPEKGLQVEATLTFSNPDDGIMFYPVPAGMQSIFKFPCQAPQEGYQNQLSLDKKIIREEEFIRQLRMPNPMSQLPEKQEDMQRYIFRVRTVRDKNGKIVNACYGKTPMKITMVSCGKAERIDMCYYFNPDPISQSLEFDTKRPVACLGKSIRDIDIRVLLMP